MGKSNAQKIIDLIYDRICHEEGECIKLICISKPRENECVDVELWLDGLIDYDAIEKLNGVLPKNRFKSNYPGKLEYEVPWNEPLVYRSGRGKQIDKRSFNIKLLDVLQKAFGDNNGKTTQDN